MNNKYENLQGKKFKHKDWKAPFLFCRVGKDSFRLIELKTGNRYCDDENDPFGGDKEDFEQVK